MTNVKFTDLAAITTPTDDAVFAVSNDVAG
jgi:hypothetical protein